MDSAAASLAFTARNYLKTHKTEVMDRGDETPQDSRFSFCVYCHKGFESSKDLYGHLRIHMQARSKTETLHINSPTRERKCSLEKDEDNDFGCFVCNESFSSMQLLCRHMRIHVVPFRTMLDNDLQHLKKAIIVL
ncbi:hypothetical protein HRI_001830600 [Hibiscus trionum]|uniref:C2H2-type domain-containing protein n=1 Tax=Hibiscus trionum TaxID=183268 RepID=A0A9W7HQC2_HIBTR|nr:hypothetical protein HRI_001830600 [Hibiscus trionum]